MSSDLKTYIGSQLKARRKSAGLNQAELAEQVDRTSEAISNIETGKSLPSIDTLMALADALGEAPADFLPAHGRHTHVSANRIRKEAEATEIIRSLTDNDLDIALVQLRAFAEWR